MAAFALRLEVLREVNFCQTGEVTYINFFLFI